MLPNFPVTEPTCCRLGCEYPAVWQPILEFRAPGSDVVAPVILRLGVCESCKPHLVVDDFLSGEGFARIAAGMEASGAMAPEKARTTLGWRRLRAEA